MLLLVDRARGSKSADIGRFLFENSQKKIRYALEIKCKEERKKKKSAFVSSQRRGFVEPRGFSMIRGEIRQI